MLDENEQNINIIELKMKIQNIEEKLNLMPTKDEMKLVVKDCIEEALKSCDKKYASKLTEKIVYAFVGIILTSVGGSLVYLVLK